MNDQYLKNLAMAESSGGKNLTNPNSSALGPYQFTRKTARNILKQMGLDPAQWRQHALDPVKSKRMAAYLTDQNARYFTAKTGRQPTPQDLYMGHFGGPKAMVKAHKNPNASLQDILSPRQAQANKNAIRNAGNMTAGGWAAQTIGGQKPDPFQSFHQPTAQPQPIAQQQPVAQPLAPQSPAQPQQSQPVPQQNPFQDHPDWAKDIRGFDYLGS